MPSSSARIGLGFAFAAVVAFAWCMSADTIVAPIEAPMAADSDAPAPAVVVAPAVATAPEANAVSAGARDLALDAAMSRTRASVTRVAGEARSGSGEPLGGWRVKLDSSRPRPQSPGRLDLTPGEVRATRYATTAADGTFAFDDLEPGDYEIDLADDGAPPVAFALARNEEKWIEMRGVGLCVEVQLVRFGSPVAHGRLQVAAGNLVTFLSTDDEGFVRCLLEPGAYDACVYNEVWPVGPTSVQPRRVAAGATTVWRLETGGVDLQVDAAYADGTPCKSFGVRIDGTLANGERAARDFSGLAGTARFARVPPGRWNVTVQAPELAPSSSREITLDNATPNERVAFVVNPGATVQLFLRDRDGACFRVDPARMPWLLASDVALRCTALWPGRNGVRRAMCGYLGVPPGRARLVVEDHVGDSGIEFLPFDPHVPIAFDVELGGDNEVVIDVLPRAMVDLRGCEAGGREELTARISVFAGDRPVLGAESAPAFRWSGWLPPGDYRVVVDRKGAVREHALHVERAAVAMRYRP